MAKRSTGSTCCITLPLILEKWQEDRLSKRFEIARQIYNTFIRAELKKLSQLTHSKEYQENQVIISRCYENQLTKSNECKLALKKRSEMLKQAGFTEYGFKHDIASFYRHFSENIGSNVAVHCIASQAWTAFEKQLFGNGRFIHFKKRGDIHSLKGYSNSKRSGGVEIIFRGDHIEWKGLHLPLKLDPNNRYETEMLKRHVKYVRILRRTGKTRDRWYAQLSLEGTPVIKTDPSTGALIHPIGCGPVGIDIGPQTIAVVSANTALLAELADQVQNIEHEKRLLQRKMDRSRRATNPDNYADNGTVKRGIKLTHNKSKRYLRMQKELAFLQQSQASIRKCQHNELANRLLSLGDRFYVEDMQWPALTRRAKETAISEKTGRYKRKKRFGKSIANKAPATLITMLKLKCTALGLPGVIEVPTSVKASQYNHITQDYQKKTLNQRWNTMPDGRKIQRDLYSAFLLRHTNSNLNGFIQESLEEDYPAFLLQHDNMIQILSVSPKTIASMGIARTHI